jgi:hypothetical protein
MPDQLDIEARLSQLPAETRDTLPFRPIPVASYEAKMLYDAASPHVDLFTRLPDFDRVLFDAMPQINQRMIESDRSYKAARDEKTASSLRPVREEAESFRSNFVSAGRYLLRKDDGAQRRIDRIVEGDGIADLVADLEEIAAFAADYADKLALDSKLPKDVPAQARSFADRLAKVQDTTAANEALARRNQLYWLLDEAVREVRAAARYVFRDDPKKLAPMLSQYGVRKPRKQTEKLL